MARETAHHQMIESLQFRGVGVEFLIIFHALRRGPGRQAAVHEARVGEPRARQHQLIVLKYAGEAEQHAGAVKP